MKHTLEADGLYYSVSGRNILSGIFIKSETGLITGLLGRNGQGKSSLMKAIFGTLDCEKFIRINQVPQSKAFTKPHLLRYLPQFSFTPKGHSIGRVFSDFNLDPGSFISLFPDLNIEQKSRIGSLSGGGLRLLEIYVILKAESQFIMLDEPFAQLSPLHSEKIKTLLVEEKKRKGIIISDHRYEDVLSVSDEVFVLSSGKLFRGDINGDRDSLYGGMAGRMF